MFQSIRSCSGRRPRQPNVEGLEGRLLFAIFPVTTTADSGVGSLRQAILDANAAPGLDSIEFGIGTGAQTITPATALPTVTDAVVITGESQPGFAAGTPVITIDGSSAGAGAEGLTINADDVTIIGLTIQDFQGNQIETSGGTSGNVIVGSMLLSPAGGGAGVSLGSADSRVGGPDVGGRNVISGLSIAGDNAIVENNRIGTNAAGTAALANPGTGLQSGGPVTGMLVTGNVISGGGGGGLLNVDGAIIQNNFIGTNADGSAAIAGNAGGGVTLDASPNGQILNNVISGNNGSGVTVANGSSDAVVSGNKIGTNAAGDAAVANQGAGVLLGGVQRVTITGNQISGNTSNGIGFADSGDDNVIQGNLIGTDAGGTGDLGNGGDGIALGDTIAEVDGTTIGGTDPAGANTIAFNDGAGVLVAGIGDGNSILGNAIFSNGGLGIDLAVTNADGRTPNDANDADLGANQFQNFPVLSQAISSGGNSTISGTLNSLANTAFRIEFFSDTAAAGAVEGRTFLGSADVTTSAAGIATFNAQVSGVTTGQQVTATATRSVAGNTSEFSDPVFGGISGPDIQISGNGMVITAGDSSPAAADFTDFGAAPVGGAGGVSRLFTVTNTGQSTLDFSTGGNVPVSISGPAAAQFSVIDQPSATLAPSATTTFEIRFDPASGGNQSATVTVVSNDADENPFTFAIAGQGTTPAPAPEIELIGNGNPIADGDVQPSADDNTDFGTATIGDSPVVRSYTITNAGQLSLTIGTVTVGGTDATQFSVTEQPASTVAPGQSTTFSVQFVPTITNQLGAILSIPSNDADENPYEFAVRGVGVAGEGQPPTASVLPQDQQPVPTLGGTTYDFLVRYADEDALSAGTFDNADITVTGPNGFSENATFVQVQTPGITQVDVRYRITAPGGTLDSADDGTYTVSVNAGQVGDASGNTVAPGAVGSFTLDLASARTSLGAFGVVDGRRVRLTITEPDNTQVTLTLNNGTGEAFRTSTGRLDLDVTGATNGKLTVTTRGGNGRAELNNVTLAGVRTFTARTGDLTGAFAGSGLSTVITLGSTVGATISSPADIRSLRVLGNMSDTQVFAGAILGSDGRFGGTGAAADTAFAGGSINRFNVTGTITQSLIAAGLNPVDDVLLNGNGVIVSPATSKLGPIKVRGSVDSATVFAAGVYPRRATLGGERVDPATDPRFDMTP